MAELRDKVATRLDPSLSPIAARHSSDTALRASLGAPVGAEQSAGGVAWQVYQYGRLYSSAASGVRFLRGAILDIYLAWGGPGVLGAPVTDDAPTTDGRGWYVDFRAARSSGRG